jgi:hypothetical protein
MRIRKPLMLLRVGLWLHLCSSPLVPANKISHRTRGKPSKSVFWPSPTVALQIYTLLELDRESGHRTS